MGIDYNSRERKKVVKSIHVLTGRDSIAYLLPFAGRFCRSGDMFAFLLASRSFKRKYGNVSFSAVVCLFACESIEDNTGFFWKKLFSEIDTNKCILYDSLSRAGFFERVEYPLSLSHVLPPNVKLHKLSPSGREALLFFRKEVKRLTKGKAKHRVNLSERLM